MTLDSGCWQYKVYADIRGGSQDLCTFSLDLHLPAPRYYTGMACRTRFQVHVCRQYLSIGVTSGIVGSGVADCDPQNIWNPLKNCECFVDATSSES